MISHFPFYLIMLISIPLMVAAIKSIIEQGIQPPADGSHLAGLQQFPVPGA